MWGWNSDTSSTRPRSPFPQGRPLLELENVRDYAAVYLDGEVPRALVTDNRKTLDPDGRARSPAPMCSSTSKTSAASPTARRSSTTRRGSSASARLGGGDDRRAGRTSRRSKCATPTPRPSRSKPLGPCGDALLPARAVRPRGARRRRLPRRLGMGHGRGVDQRPLPRLVLGRGETAVDPHSRRASSRRRREPHSRWFSTSRTTTPPRRCASRTNPCSNNKHNR